MASPPKPWERAGAPATIAASLSAASAATTAPTLTASSSATPSVPARPAAIMNTASTSLAQPGAYGAYNSPYSRLGSTMSPYGGGIGAYGSTYGGMGSYGNSYGGLGSYGNTYGGFGSYGMGMNSMYPGFGGGYMPGALGGNPYDPLANPSLTQTLESTTQSTFALLQAIVQTFSGVAQMLESTFMATHSSFFAMVGVVDQFAQLRNALGSVLGLFGLVKAMRDFITGGTPPGAGLRHEFRDFLDGRPVQGPQPRPPPGPRPSKKPLIVFLIAVFGVPYAMHKLVRVLAARQEEERARIAAAGGLSLVPGQPLPPLDPSQLAFARALYEFTPGAPTELALKENEIVAIVGKLDLSTGMEVDPRLIPDAKGVEQGEWWKGRTRDGREGWFPRKWVQVLDRQKMGKGELPMSISAPTVVSKPV